MTAGVRARPTATPTGKSQKEVGRLPKYLSERDQFGAVVVGLVKDGCVYNKRDGVEKLEDMYGCT